jgi:quinoprotein glucose dehydrogenase
VTLILRGYAFLLLLTGAALAVGGAHLILLGGSAYYLPCGIALLTSSVLLWSRRAEGATVYGLLLLATLVWSIWEVGVDGWALMPRILALAFLGLFPLLPFVRRTLSRRWRVWGAGRVSAAVVLAVALGIALHSFVPPYAPADPLYQTGMIEAPSATPRSSIAGDGDWRNYGNDAGGMRFSSLQQITPNNVPELEAVWSFRVGEGRESHGLETTPLKIDRTLYLCTGDNEVIALDAETGTQRWRFDPHVDTSKVPHHICRGVAYVRPPGATGACAERIITNTTDARLIALDAVNGTPCRDFGSDGQVSLLRGMGKVPPGYYFVTSAPTVIQGNVVLGGYVVDDQYWGEPSGVIRAFDVVTGKLAWAWDMGRPDRQTEPDEGDSYTEATPNSWGPMSADPALGLVYVPTANTGSADYFGAYRRSFDEKYGSSVVALDAASGKVRWSFQTVHHDLWDYDVASQPTLLDYETSKGVVHALIQPTKRGELFVLDRATGTPLYPVKERAVPQRGVVPEERVAPTQPFSVGMPSFRGADLVEKDMWGMTPIDQLWCRVKFRQARYEGTLTPPGLTPSIQLPGTQGGMEWGGVAVDPDRKVVIVNSNVMPMYTQLFTRAEADHMGLKRYAAGVAFDEFTFPQENTPYAVRPNIFLSPLGTPCNRPPYGRISAVDVGTGKLFWTRAFGSARELGPLGIRSRLPFTLGTFSAAGAVVTRSGLVFIASSFDRYFRAFETMTGRLLWQVSLPGGGGATPMTYISPASQRQFVVTAANGNDGVHSTSGAFIVAYALPKRRGK